MADKRLNIKVRVDGARKAKQDLKGVSGGIAKLGKAAGVAAAAFFGARMLISGLQKTIELSTKFEGVERGFTNLTKAAGFSAKTFDNLHKATDGTVDSIELMTQANNAMLLGIFESEDQMANMFDTAQRLAKALGKDTRFGIESLVTGMGRQSKLMLDNLGIMVKAEDAYKQFAESVGVTVSELTDQQRKQAFVNAAMTEANKLVSTLGEEQLTTGDAIKQMKASINDAAIALGDLFSPVVLTVANNLRDAANFTKEFLTGLKNIAEFGDVGGIEAIKKQSDETLEGTNKLKMGIRSLTRELSEMGVDVTTKQFRKDLLMDAEGNLRTDRERAEMLAKLLAMSKELNINEQLKVDLLKNEELPLLKEVYVPTLNNATEAQKRMAEFSAQTASSLFTSAIMGDSMADAFKRALFQQILITAQLKIQKAIQEKMAAMQVVAGGTGGFLMGVANFLFGASPTQTAPSAGMASASRITINQNFGGMGVIDHNFAANNIIPAINKAISTGQARIG